MNLTLPEKLVVASAVVLGGLSAIGVGAYVRSYEQVPSPAVIDNPSVFVVPFFLLFALFVVSAIGFFGVLLGPAQRSRTYAFVFAVGVVIINLARWVAMALGVLRFPDALGLLFALLGNAWFIGLAVALRADNSLKRTAVDRLQ